MARDLRALDELDRNAETVVVPLGPDNEPETAGAELFAQSVCSAEERVQGVVCEGATRDGCRNGF